MRCIFLILLILSPQLRAQEHVQIDSLEQLLKKNLEDTEKMGVLYDLCYHYRNVNPEIALQYGKEALQLAEALKDQRGRAGVLNRLGLAHRNMGQYEVANDHFLTALEINSSLDDWKMTAACLTNLGSLMSRMKQPKKALEYYRQSLKLKKKNNAKELELAEEHNNIGTVYFHSDVYDSALYYFRLSEPVFKKLNFTDGLSASYNNLAGVHYYLKNYEKAIQYSEKALKLTKEDGNLQGVAMIYYNISDLYAELGRFDTAIAYVSMGLEMAKKGRFMHDVMYAYDAYAEVCRKKGDYECAFKYQSRYITLKDSLDNVENSRAIVELQAQYEKGRGHQQETGAAIRHIRRAGRAPGYCSAAFQGPAPP